MYGCIYVGMYIFIYSLMYAYALFIYSLKELGHHISDHHAINSTAILFLPYKEAISLDYCQFTGLWVQ